MASTLPRNIQLKLDQALNQWRQWRCDPPLEKRPRIVSTFNTGVSNHSVLVEAGQRFVVRTGGVHTANNSLSLSTEWRVLQTAHTAGLAPCPRYHNPELGVLVCDYLPSKSHHVGKLTETAALLRRIHQLPASHRRLNLRERITRYEKQIEHHERELPAVMGSAREVVIELLDKLSEQNGTLVLCHNDLLAANRIVSDDRLWAIDWEYCAMGSLWFDLAVVAIGDQLDAGQKQVLISSYLEREVTADEQLRFSQNCIVYQYLELLWYLANTPQDLDLRLRDLKEALSRENY